MDREINTQVYQTDDSSQLREVVARLFNAHFKEVLDVLSARFAHTPGDGSLNEVEFKGLRAKILRSGNNKLRELPEILAEYSIVKMIDTEYETKKVNTPVVVR